MESKDDLTTWDTGRDSINKDPLDTARRILSMVELDARLARTVASHNSGVEKRIEDLKRLVHFMHMNLAYALEFVEEAEREYKSESGEVD